MELASQFFLCELRPTDRLMISSAANQNTSLGRRKHLPDISDLLDGFEKANRLAGYQVPFELELRLIDPESIAFSLMSEDGSFPPGTMSEHFNALKHKGYPVSGGQVTKYLRDDILKGRWNEALDTKGGTDPDVSNGAQVWNWLQYNVLKKEGYYGLMIGCHSFTLAIFKGKVRIYQAYMAPGYSGYNLTLSMEFTNFIFDKERFKTHLQNVLTLDPESPEQQESAVKLFNGNCNPTLNTTANNYTDSKCGSVSCQVYFRQDAAPTVDEIAENFKTAIATHETAWKKAWALNARQCAMKWVINPALATSVEEERAARSAMVEKESALSHPAQRMLAIARGTKTRQANRQAADATNNTLDERLNPSIKLYKQVTNAEGRTDFVVESSERSAAANTIGHFWSGPQKYIRRDKKTGDMVNPNTSGEYQAKEATKTSGRMMTQTAGHKMAIEFIRKNLTQEVFDAKMLEERGDPNNKNPLKPADFITIQKNPENDLVYNHFRNGEDGIFDLAWGPTSREYASDRGNAMLPSMVHGAKDHANFHGTVQTTVELPAFQEAAIETEAAVREASRLNQIAALAGKQLPSLLRKDPKEWKTETRTGQRYKNAVKQRQAALDLSAGATTYREGADKQQFDSDAYRAAMLPEEELDEKKWDNRTKEQITIATKFEETAHQGTKSMEQGRADTLRALEKLKKNKRG